MPMIRLSRAAPLTVEEVLALPAEVQVAELGTEERLTLSSELPLAVLIPLLYALGAIVPGCTIVLDAPAEAAPAAAPEADPGTDPWKLVDAGDPRAEKVFAGTPLDSAGRSRVQIMLASPEAATVALGCRVARLTDWKSGVQLIRKLVAHPSAAVRKDAVIAIGELAGPSLTMTIRPLRTDPDPEVRAAAIVVLKRFGD